MEQLPDWIREMMDRGLLSREQAEGALQPVSGPAPESPAARASETTDSLFSCPTCSCIFTLSGTAAAAPLCPTCRGVLRPARLGGVIFGALEGQSSGSATFGRYRLLRELGRGGMGVVWLAEDLLLRRNVALKMLLTPHLDINPEAAERFLREARAAARLSHPGIVALHDVGIIDGRHYFTMDLVDGPTLGDILDSPAREAWPRGRLVELVSQVAAALGYAHSRGIVHRDVKPRNILVGPDGRPRLSDFGLARDLDCAAKAESLGGAGAVIGTPQYMSPEQAAPARGGVGPPSDVFALGVVLYRALTGRLPFLGAGLESLVATLTVDPEPPARLDPSIPPPLERICLRCLQKDPALRFPDGSSLARDLERFIAGLPVETPDEASSGTTDPDPMRSVAEALSLLERARPALDAAERAIEEPASSVEELFRRVEGVQTLLARARERAPDLALTAYLAGRAWDLLGHEERAEECWRESIRLDAAFAPAHFRLGRLLATRAYLTQISAEHEIPELAAESRRLAEEAERELDAALADGSGFDDALYRRVAAAMAAWTRNDRVEARRLCSEGLRDFPGVPGREEFHFLLGMLSEGAEKVSALDEAIRIRPRYALALFSRGGAQANLSNWEAARADLDKAIRVRPRFARALSSRGAVRVCQRDQDGAIRDYDRSIALRPNSPITLSNRGNARCIGGDLEGGISDYAEAVRIAPSFLQARTNRANALVELGRAREAVEELTGVLRLDPGLADALAIRAGALGALGDSKGALADLDEAIRLSPDAPEPYLHRSRLRTGAGDVAGARSDLDLALRHHPEFTEALIERGQHRIRTGDMEGAASDLHRARQIWTTAGPLRNRDSIMESLKVVEAALRPPSPPL